MPLYSARRQRQDDQLTANCGTSPKESKASVAVKSLRGQLDLVDLIYTRAAAQEHHGAVRQRAIHRKPQCELVVPGLALDKDRQVVLSRQFDRYDDAGT